MDTPTILLLKQLPAELWEEGTTSRSLIDEIIVAIDYPYVDDIWPSRRWNIDRTDYIDLSGVSFQLFPADDDESTYDLNTGQ